MKKFSNSNEPEFRKGLTEDEINSPEFNPDDFAPAPETGHGSSENESLENKRNSLVFAFVAAFLALVICLCGLGVSASVENYNKKLEEEKILSVFPNCDRIEAFNKDIEGYKVYAVFFKDRIAGFCVSGTAEGFGGEIEILVAFNSDNIISGVQVAAHNESMGLGSKICGDDFLSQFKNRLIGDSSAQYVIVAGATTSSRAVGEFVRSVLELDLTTNYIASQLGYEIISEEEIEEEIKKEEEDKTQTEDTTGPADTTGRPGPGNNQGGSNVNTGDGDIGVDGEDETTVYESETEENEDTIGDTTDSTEAPVTDTAPPESETVGDTTILPDTETDTQPADSETESAPSDSETETTPQDSDTLSPDTTGEDPSDTGGVSDGGGSGNSNGPGDPISDVIN